MTNKDSFDVLNISVERKSVDIIQALLGDKCLGTYFHNGTAKLYFNSGVRELIDKKLKNYLVDQTIQWLWGTQVDADWSLSWQDYFNPVLIENKLVVIPHWENDYPAEYTIKIKPGMAFGTGHHESTCLMLRLMLKYIHPGMSVLDLGTGSGILSILANKMGASKVDSVENDLKCKSNFYENLELNKIREGIQFHYEDLLSWKQLNYDIILANINKEVIQKLIPKLKAISSSVIISGLLKRDYNDIYKACKTNGLIISKKIFRSEWMCIIINQQ